MGILLTADEVHELVKKALRLKNKELAKRGMRPTSWLGDLDWELVAKAQLKKVVKWLQMCKVGERHIVNNQFVDGKPNCVIFTQVDWQALLRENRQK